MQNKIEKKLFTTATGDIKDIGINLKMCKVSILKNTLQREIFLKPNRNRYHAHKLENDI